jgi:hypothetical protein
MCGGFFGQIPAFLLLLHVYYCRVQNIYKAYPVVFGAAL